MIDLNQQAEIAFANAWKRSRNGANISTDTIKMLKHTATEVVEATEAYSYKGKQAFASELSDIICCALIMACKEKIDIEQAVNDCLERNTLRAQGKGDRL